MSNKLNLGCGLSPVKGWINVDKFITLEGLKSKTGQYINSLWEEGAEFIQADILKLPFPDEYADYTELHQVLEHLKYRDVIPALREIRRVMKTGSQLILDVPCFDGIALEWIEMRLRGDFDWERYTNIMQTIVGSQAGDTEGEVHKCLFNPQFMNACLNTAGFFNGEMFVYYRGSKMVKIGELGGTDRPDRVFRNDTLAVKVKK